MEIPEANGRAMSGAAGRRPLRRCGGRPNLTPPTPEVATTVDLAAAVGSRRMEEEDGKDGGGEGKCAHRLPHRAHVRRRQPGYKIGETAMGRGVVGRGGKAPERLDPAGRRAAEARAVAGQMRAAVLVGGGCRERAGVAVVVLMETMKL